MLVVVGAVRSSPGTTTTVLALAGCLRDSVVVEGDPDGSVLVARFGLSREPNLATLAAAVRGDAGSGALLEHTQALPGGLPVVAGLVSPDRAVGVWRSAGGRLGDALADLGCPVLVDAGRLTPTSPLLPLLAQATLTILVARPTVEELHPLAHRLDALRQASQDLALVLIGDEPYGPDEIGAQLGVDVLGVLAADPRAAAALNGDGSGGRALRRSALSRSAGEIAAALLTRVEHAASTTTELVDR